MDIGNRLKQRRLELELTVDDLAAIVGKSRATIYRYENGDIENMPTTVLEPLAQALQTTPAYLMGWEETLPKKAPTDYVVSSEKQTIPIELFQNLNDEGQKRALEYMTMLQQLYPKQQSHLLNAAHERTDIDIADEMRQHDDDIMDDENF